MKRIGIVTLGLVLYALLLQAQPRSLPLSLDSLSRVYPLFTHNWLYQAGDDIRWASPTLDDRNWMPYQPYFNLEGAPPGWHGIGWFRLHITLDSLPANQLLSFVIDQLGATEVFVDGKRVGGFGIVGRSASSGADYVSHNALLTFPIQQSGHHVLVVRQATFRPYITRGMRYQQGFRSWLATDGGAMTAALESNRVTSINLLSAVVPGWFALLHLFLFLFYPARRSNLYYSLWLMGFAATSACVYLEYFATNPLVSQALAYAFWLGNVAFSILGVVFIYSVCYTTFPRLIWLFYGLALLTTVLTTFHFTLYSTPWRSGFVLLCLLEVFRVVILATLRGQSGVWLIGVGLLAVAFGIFVGASDVLHLWQNNTGGQTLFLTACFLALPLFTSLYLAWDFADRLKQVEQLSAQTRAQEAEKLTLIAGQNEQLEQTVRERTDQLQRQTDKLQGMDAAKSRFFTNLTHEFRTPLTLILGPAEQVLTQANDPHIRQQAALIQRNGNRLLRLINQLLDLSKLEAGKMSLTSAPVDLVRLVQGTLQSFESLTNQKAISIVFTTGQERLVVNVDRDKLEKILCNLLSNAIKFTPVGGTVSVSLTNGQPGSEGWIELSVQDTGPGIPTAKQPYIFDRFYQADASDTREQEGTGIGLALTKELVDLHGGILHLSSQEGIGTLVTVQLPMQAALIDDEVSERPMLPDQSTTSPEATVPNSEGPSLVLLIEDNDDVRAFIRSSLSEHPGTELYRIIEAPNGEAGLQVAQQQVPDLVITDLMMPIMDGYAVCKRLKGDERTSHIPVIMLTARADLDSKLEGLETGADVYLAKPFSQRELRAHLVNLISLRRQLQQRYSRATLGQSRLDQPKSWSTNTSTLPSMEQVFLHRVWLAIDEHLGDEGYSVERLSDDVGLSRTQLHRKLKALTNEAPGDLIRQLRLQRAHDLLTTNVGTVAEVAYSVGFSNSANFSTSFSRHYGYAPSEVRGKSKVRGTVNPGFDQQSKPDQFDEKQWKMYSTYSTHVMQKWISLYIMGLLLSSLACQQQEVEPPAHCEFARQRGWTTTEGDNYTYLYDATNRLNQVIYRSGSQVTNYHYTYQGQQATIKVEFTGSDWIRIHYDVLLNERGDAVSAQETTSQRINGRFDNKRTASHTFGYDATGYLIDHQVDMFSYPVVGSKAVTTYRQRIGYLSGNPVTITHDAGTISNRYGTEPNPLHLPLLLEADRQAFVLRPLQPLLGKPPVNLIIFQKETTAQRTDSTRYEYQFDANRQLTKTVLQPGNPNAYAYVPFTCTYHNTCP